MRAFGRPRSLNQAPLETRLTYSCFLVFITLGVATMVALSAGRIGFTPDAIATYYRGGDSELSFPRTFWQLMEVSHFHLFSVPLVLLVLTHLLYATPVSPRVRLSFTGVTWGGALLQLGSPWAIRYVSGAFAWTLMAGWVLLSVGAMVLVGVSLRATWRAVKVLDADAEDEDA